MRGSSASALLSVCASVLLAACMGDPASQTAEVKAADDLVASAPVCCASYAELKYEPAERDKSIDYQHGAGLPAMVVEGSKSFVKPLQLPDSARRMNVALRFSKRQWGLPNNGKSTVVYPSFLFLDADYKVVLDTRRPPFGYDENHWIEAPTMEGRFDLTALDNRARYVVIYTRQDNQGAAVCFWSRDMGYMVAHYANIFFDPGSEPHCTSNSILPENMTLLAETGELTVEFQ